MLCFKSISCNRQHITGSMLRFIATILLITMTQTSFSCDLPPELWCDSETSATRCGVVGQCDRYRQNFNRTTVKLTMMYEALCPFCQRFFTHTLGALFARPQPRIQLELIPWGNARMLSDGTFSCNHGRKECDANRLHSCVLDSVSIKQALPFIVCFERLIIDAAASVHTAFSHCAPFVRSHTYTIKKCFDGQRGIELQRAAARRTIYAGPQPIVEVPYLLVNDYSPSVSANTINIMALPQLIHKWTKETQK